MAGEVTQKDIEALDAKIANLQGLLGQYGKLQQEIDKKQIKMMNLNTQRFELNKKRIENLEKAMKSKR